MAENIKLKDIFCVTTLNKDGSVMPSVLRKMDEARFSTDWQATEYFRAHPDPPAQDVVPGEQRDEDLVEPAAPGPLDAEEPAPLAAGEGAWHEAPAPAAAVETGYAARYRNKVLDRLRSVFTPEPFKVPPMMSTKRRELYLLHLSHSESQLSLIHI